MLLLKVSLFMLISHSMSVCKLFLFSRLIDLSTYKRDEMIEMIELGCCISELHFGKT